MSDYSFDDIPDDADPNDPALRHFAHRAAADVLEVAAIAAARPGDLDAVHQAWERLIDEETADEQFPILLGAAIGIIADLVRHMECPHQSAGDVVLAIQARVAAIREEHP